MHPDDQPWFQLEIEDDDERFTRIMTVWLEWLRRQLREEAGHG